MFCLINLHIYILLLDLIITYKRNLHFKYCVKQAVKTEMWGFLDNHRRSIMHILEITITFRFVDFLFVIQYEFFLGIFLNSLDFYIQCIFLNGFIGRLKDKIPLFSRK